MYDICVTYNFNIFNICNSALHFLSVSILNRDPFKPLLLNWAPLNKYC